MHNKYGIELFVTSLQIYIQISLQSRMDEESTFNFVFILFFILVRKILSSFVRWEKQKWDEKQKIKTNWQQTTTRKIWWSSLKIRQIRMSCSLIYFVSSSSKKKNSFSFCHLTLSFNSPVAWYRFISHLVKIHFQYFFLLVLFEYLIGCVILLLGKIFLSFLSDFFRCLACFSAIKFQYRCFVNIMKSVSSTHADSTKQQQNLRRMYCTINIICRKLDFQPKKIIFTGESNGLQIYSLTFEEKVHSGSDWRQCMILHRTKSEKYFFAVNHDFSFKRNWNDDFVHSDHLTNIHITFNLLSPI